ncbi:MAG: protein kinase [Planctomycetota bacterium]
MSAPQRVGPYALGEKLGQGGMGAVWAARHVETGREVALKVMRLDALDREASTRFGREVEALLAVDHPHVVRVLDAGRVPGGIYLALELVRGESLAARLARAGPLPAPEAARLLVPLCEALAAAHAGGVLHRDLKPENVVLARGRCAAPGQHDDASGVAERSSASAPANVTPVLLDFGVALPLDARERLTRTGELVGTPGYMAPEQVEGEAQGPWTDVYGLGALLFATLCGVPPFRGSSALVTLEQVVGAPPPRPSERGASDGRLDEVVLRCLAKDPRERYLDPLALAAALRACADEPPRAPGRGRGLRAATGAAALVALALGLGVVAGRAPRGASPEASLGTSPPGPSPEESSPPDGAAELLGRTVPAPARAAWTELERALARGDLPAALKLADALEAPGGAELAACARVRVLGRAVDDQDERIAPAWGPTRARLAALPDTPRTRALRALLECYAARRLDDGRPEVPEALAAARAAAAVWRAPSAPGRALLLEATCSALGRLTSLQGQLGLEARDLAAELLPELERVAPWSAQATYLRGMLAWSLALVTGDEDGAQRARAQLADVARRGSPWLRLTVAQMLGESERDEPARAAALLALAGDASLPAPGRGLAVLAALDLLQDPVKRSPPGPAREEAHQRALRACEDALELLRRAPVCPPGAVVARQGALELLVMHPAPALELLTRAGELAGREEARRLDWRAQAYGALRRFDEARADFDRALELHPNAASYLLRGQTRTELGDALCLDLVRAAWCAPEGGLFTQVVSAIQQVFPQVTPAPLGAGLGAELAALGPADVAGAERLVVRAPRCRELHAALAERLLVAAAREPLRPHRLHLRVIAEGAIWSALSRGGPAEVYPALLAQAEAQLALTEQGLALGATPDELRVRLNEAAALLDAPGARQQPAAQRWRQQLARARRLRLSVEVAQATPDGRVDPLALEAARQTVEEGLASTPGRWPEHGLLLCEKARLLLAGSASDYSLALGVAAQAWGLQGGDAETRGVAAALGLRVRLALDQPEEAAEGLEHTRGLDPAPHWQRTIAAALLAHRLGDVEREERELRRALELSPLAQHPRLLEQLGRLHQRRRRRERALRCAEAAVLSAPRRLGPRLLHVELLRELGREDDARRLLALARSQPLLGSAAEREQARRLAGGE